MIILAVDYGDARTGLAVCDKNEILATALGTVHERYEPLVIEAVKKAALEHHAECIVVGKPVNMDGSEGERAKKCIEFSQKLHTETGIPCDLYDERMTTMIAHQSLSFTNTRGKKRKEAVDALSAQIILQDYIDARK